MAPALADPGVRSARTIRSRALNGRRSLCVNGPFIGNERLFLVAPRDARRAAAAALLACAIALASACDPDQSPAACDAFGTNRAAIVGGAAVDGADDGVGYLRVVAWRDGSTAVDLCTVTRVAPGRALTAAHCIGDAPAWQAWVGFGAQALGPPLGACEAMPQGLASVLDRQPHQELDLDLLAFDESAAPGPSLPVDNQPPIVGQTVLLEGYGVNENGLAGVKRAVASVISGRDGPLITVDGHGTRGACAGDSGGPLLVLGQDANANARRVAGVLSAGSADCRGRDQYTSGGIADWLDHLGIRCE